MTLGSAPALGGAIERRFPGAHRHRSACAPSRARSRRSPTTRAAAGRGRCSWRCAALHADGAAFARDAVARGARADRRRDAARQAASPRRGYRSSDARLALAALAAAFYGDPSRELVLVGITGTNGKTTTTYLLASIFEAAGVMCGRIGTIGYRVGNHEADAARTTPEAPDLQRLLRDMVTARLRAPA